MRAGTESPLVCVAPDMLDSVWPLAEPFLISGCLACDETPPDNLLEWLKAEKGLLWVYVRERKLLAAMITSLELRPSGKVCRLGLTGGTDLQQWKDCEARIVEYARAEGCVKMVLEGRPGWKRVLPGYSILRVQLEKVL